MSEKQKIRHITENKLELIHLCKYCTNEFAECGTNNKMLGDHSNVEIYQELYPNAIDAADLVYECNKFNKNTDKEGNIQPKW